MINENSQNKKCSQHREAKKIEHYVFSYAYELGAGSFSKVFKGVDIRDNSTVAIKIVQRDKMTTNIAKTLLSQEMDILKQLNHENVIHCFDILYSLNNCYIVTEFCQYGDLSKLIKTKKNKFSTSTAMIDSESMYSEQPSKSSKMIHRALQNPLLYEQAVSLLQYCRLLSRVCSCVKSDILEQWLLNLIYNVHKAKLKQNQLIDYTQYRETVAMYYNRYYKQFKDRGARAPIDIVLKQCAALLQKDKKYMPLITAVTNETNILSQALSHPLRLLYFARTSQAVTYI